MGILKLFFLEDYPNLFKCSIKLLNTIDKFLILSKFRVMQLLKFNGHVIVQTIMAFGFFVFIYIYNYMYIIKVFFILLFFIYPIYKSFYHIFYQIYLLRLRFIFFIFSFLYLYSKKEKMQTSKKVHLLICKNYLTTYNIKI